MFELIRPNTKIPFMKYRLPMILFSLAMTMGALFFIQKNGFNYGVDFSGGVQIVLSLPESLKADAESLRKNLEQIGIENASVQVYGTRFETKPTDFIVHFPAEFLNGEFTSEKIESALMSSRPADMKPTDKMVGQYRFVGLEKAYITLSRPVSLEVLRKALSTVSFGMMTLVDVNTFGHSGKNEFQLSFMSIGKVVTDSLSKQYSVAGQDEIKALRVDFVGAKVGSDLRMAALLSLIITTALIFLYIFIRFDLVYAPGVVVALVHDVLIAAGYFAYSGYEFDLTTVAALLTLAGYSINDTIIVYDRIREISGTLRGKPFMEIINIAVNQTLGRTIITSGTTFIATLALWTVGGPVIHGFATAFLIGIIVGTYSSVFVAAPMVLWMHNLIGHKDARAGRAAA